MIPFPGPITFLAERLFTKGSLILQFSFIIDLQALFPNESLAENIVTGQERNMPPRSARVGFAGLGAMGFGMASNLLKNGVATLAFDLNPFLLERFTEVGGSVAKTVSEAGKGQ